MGSEWLLSTTTALSGQSLDVRRPELPSFSSARVLTSRRGPSVSELITVGLTSWSVGVGRLWFSVCLIAAWTACVRWVLPGRHPALSGEFGLFRWLNFQTCFYISIE